MIPNDNVYECPEESGSDSGSSDGNPNVSFSSDSEADNILPDANVLCDDVMGGDGSLSAPDGNKGCGRGDRRGVGRGGGRDGREYGSGGGHGGREYSRVGSQEEGGSCGDSGARDRGRNENKDDRASSADLAASLLVGEYNSEVFLAVVEGEDPDEEMPGYTLLKYLEKRAKTSTSGASWICCTQLMRIFCAGCRHLSLSTTAALD